MNIDVLKCPSCGHALPENVRPDHLIKCPACNMTLLLSDWQIDNTRSAMLISTASRVYTVRDLLAKDDICNLYRCSYTVDGTDRQGLFRLARSADNNDLVENEAKSLYRLQAAKNYDDFRPFLPMALESFLYQDVAVGRARQANILGFDAEIASPSEMYSLEEVRKYYAKGIDARDMAWMWRRLLNIMGYIHECGMVHGAVLPSNVLIEPKEHKLMLMGWDFSLRDNPRNAQRLQGMSTTFERMYPPEVTDRQPVTSSIDLFMGAHCMLYLLGIDPQQPNTQLEKPLHDHFARCLAPSEQDRPQEAWQVLSEFDVIIEQLWGPRTFREFRMPYKA